MTTITEYLAGLIEYARRMRMQACWTAEFDALNGYVDEESDEESAEPMTAAEIVVAFNDETANLHVAYSEMADLTAEPKWAGARKRIAKANLNDIADMAQGLQRICDDLMDHLIR